MNPPFRLLFIVLAVALFLVGLFEVLGNGDAKIIQTMLFGGLASFSLAHV